MSADITPEVLGEVNSLLSTGLGDGARDDSESLRAWIRARDLMIEHGLGVECLVGTIPENADSRFGEYGKQKMPFGKYRGVTLGEIAINDPGYLNWIWDNTNINDQSLLGAIAHIRRELAG